MADLERNKQTVIAFYETAFNTHDPANAIARYAGPNYRQHNPEVEDGPEGFIRFVSGFAATFPQLRADVRRVIAEGDFVVLHVLVRTHPEDRGMVAMDMFRLEDGRIVEHWDVLQPVPEKSMNDNGML
jgi:predicted SnoaL-like aldol condensation-catalyzing enzyme